MGSPKDRDIFEIGSDIRGSGATTHSTRVLNSSLVPAPGSGHYITVTRLTDIRTILLPCRLSNTKVKI